MIPRSKPTVNLLIKSGSKLHLEQTRTALFNKYRHGPQKVSNPNRSFLKHVWWKITDPVGRKALKDDYSYILKWPFKMEFNRDPRDLYDKTRIFEHFNSEESLQRWKPAADSDSMNGYSTSHLSRSPAGHALFHGVIDNTLPDDGLTANSGFAAIMGPRARRWHLFNIEPFWDWSKYNCFEIRYRGDGRRYNIVLNRGSYFDDLGYYDNYAYPIFTRGGPYWQTLRIPFSKFIYNYRSFTQDRQGYLPSRRITFVSIVIQDKIDGPFALEIDYMGLRRNHLPLQEFSAYELYKIKHLRWRSLSVESPPPQIE